MVIIVTKEKTAEKEQENRAVISYHTFMFPFLYATDKMTRKEFGSHCHPGWCLDLWEPEITNGQIYYNQYHYFNETAHNAIYTTKNAKNSKKSKLGENFENAAVINLRFDLPSLITEKASENPEEKKADSFEYVIRKYMEFSDRYSERISEIRCRPLRSPARLHQAFRRLRVYQKSAR